MSLNRSRMTWKEPVDPYAVVDSDEEAEQKKEVAAKAAAKRGRVKAKGRAVSGGADVSAPPKLKDDWMSVEKEVALIVPEEDLPGISLVKMNAAVEPSASVNLFTKTDEQNTKRAVSTRLESDTANKPLFRYLDFGSSEFQTLRQPFPDGVRYYLARPTAENPDVIAAHQVSMYYHAQPCVKTAADLLDIEEIERKMRQKQLSLNMAVAGVELSQTEEKNFVEKAKAAYGGVLTKKHFENAWEAVKGEPPSSGVVRTLFGTGQGFTIGVDDIVYKLRGLSSAEEAAARALKNQERADDEEQDFVEEVEGTEKMFDDDLDDKPELNPDQSLMDSDTKKWTETEKIQEEPEGTEKTHLEKLTEQPDPSQQDGDDDDDTEAADVNLLEKLPPPPPVQPTTTTTTTLRKRKAAQPDAPPPKKKPISNPLHQSIDAALHRTLTPAKKPLATVKKQIVASLPQFSEMKKQAATLESQGKIASKEMHVKKEVMRWGTIIEARIKELGGKIDGEGNVSMG